MSRAVGAPGGREATEAVRWHDVECSGYGADLPLWRELAAERAGEVLELGCGTGRVALDLAARGHRVTGLDPNPALVRALVARARDRRLPARAWVGDARSFELGRSFPLILAPMQVIQLLGSAEGRSAALGRVRRHLLPGGLFAAALADPLEGLPAEAALPPLPDVREEDGWLFSSTPTALRSTARGALAIERHRQAVSPAGELSESVASIELDAVSPEELEREAERHGLGPLARRHVPGTGAYVGSTVVLLEAM